HLAAIEVGELDDEGHFVWSVRTSEPLRAFTATRAHGGVAIFAGGEQGAFTILGAATGASRGGGHLPGRGMVARAMTDGPGGARAVLAGGLAQPAWQGHSGHVAVIGLDGRVGLRFPVDGQVMDVGAVDLDGDGQEEIAVANGAYQLVVLGAGGDVLWKQRVE